HSRRGAVKYSPVLPGAFEGARSPERGRVRPGPQKVREGSVQRQHEGVFSLAALDALQDEPDLPPWWGLRVLEQDLPRRGRGEVVLPGYPAVRVDQVVGAVLSVVPGIGGGDLGVRVGLHVEEYRKDIQCEGVVAADDRYAHPVTGFLGRPGEEVLPERVAVHLKIGDESVHEDEVAEGRAAPVVVPADLDVVTDQLHRGHSGEESTADVG